MPVAPVAAKTPTRARACLAGLFVGLTVVGVWKFIDYRNQPPPPPSSVSATDH